MNNMFSKKFQDDLFKKKYDSMKQLDRIELQNNEILFNNNGSSDECYIVGVIAFFFSLSFTANYMYLFSLGLNSFIHIEMAKSFAIIGVIFLILHFIVYLLRKGNIMKFIKEREKFLEEHTK